MHVSWKRVFLWKIREARRPNKEAQKFKKTDVSRVIPGVMRRHEELLLNLGTLDVGPTFHKQCNWGFRL